MITEADIRERLAMLLAHGLHEASIAVFADWLVEQSWNMHLDSTDRAQRLVADIEHCLIAYADDHITHAGFHKELVTLQSGTLPP